MARWAVASLSFGLAALAAWTVFEFSRDLREHRSRVAQGSRLLETACGRVEWAEAGPADGPPLLVIHGSGGGFDQGLLLGADPAARGWRVIAPSRFGYLRTPFPTDPSGERQADQFACLLDALGVPRAAVLGVSAGGIPALHFAIRHPERTSALVLMVPAVYRPDAAVPMPGWALRLLDAVIGADLPFWLLQRWAPGFTRSLVLATPAAAYDHADAAERQRADALMAAILPVSARRLGLLHDSAQTTAAARVALESIRAPTLCISARDDGFGTWASARYTAAHVPGARFVGFDDGGHLLLGHQARVGAEIDAFLRAALPPRR
jgi:pimeloyl-ACP methyl ester carboxylesterase